jgi:hypothetical protein
LSAPSFGSDGKNLPGSWEDARTSDILLDDLDDVLRVIPGGVLPYKGARYVVNLIGNISGASSQDLESTGWSSGNVTLTYGVEDPDGGSTATTITSTGGTAYHLIQPTVGDGTSGDFRNTIWVRRRTGTGAIYLYRPNDTVQAIDGNLTSEWKRFTTSITVGKTATTIRLGIVIGTNGDAIDVWAPQGEYVTGQSVQTPGEYQLVDGSYDGIGIYNTENGNTVDGNYIVTEAVGSAIGTAPVIVHHPAATNVFLNSDAPATQDITLAVGDWTLSVHGSGTVTSSAGTATGTGYGAATEGSDNTINITVEGTVTFTVSGGTPDYVQVENRTFSTPPIVTGGASASRDVVKIRQAFSAAIFKQISGFAYIDLTPDHAQTALTATDEGLLSVADSASNLMFIDSGNLQSTDGTNTATVDPNYAADTKIRFLVYWDKAQDVLGIGYRTLPGGTFTWATEQSYDDAFATGSYFNLLYGNAHNWDIHNLGVVSKHQDQSYYEDNY